MADLSKFKNEKIHTRNITITTYRTNDGSIMVEGILRDDRQKDTYSLSSGIMKPPGAVHDLTIRLLFDSTDLIIRDVDVELSHVPREECRMTLESLKPLIGQRIASGFSLWVKQNLGGPKGCTHLNSLLLAMAPAAVQGFWTNRSDHMISMKDTAEQFKNSKYVIDSCFIWRKDGPVVKNLLSNLSSEETD